MSIVLVTFNRRRFLERCLNALERTLPNDTQCIVWDNASTDGTADLLGEWCQEVKAHKAPWADQVQVIYHPENLGIDAYARAMKLAKGQYLVALDDDVIDLPQEWAERMMNALDRVPRLGLLSLDVVQDEKTAGGKPGPEHYQVEDIGDGISVGIGPAGGWCCMTRRQVYDEVGGFPELGRPYYHYDGIYSDRLRAAQYLTGILSDVKAYHACGEVWSRELGYEGEQKSKEAERLTLEGDCARRDWRFDDAISFYHKSLELSSQLKGIWERLADCYFMLEQYEKADDYLKKAQAENPSSGRVWYLRSLIYLRDGKYSTAMEMLEDLKTRFPKSPWIHDLMKQVELFGKSMGKIARW